MADVAEAAVMLGCSDRTIRKLVEAGELVPKDWSGKSPLFYRADVNRLVGTIKGGRNPLNRCGMCDRPLHGGHVEWGPLRSKLHPACVPELNRRISDVLDARYCPVCHGTRTLDMPGGRLLEVEQVPCVCVRKEAA